MNYEKTKHAQKVLEERGIAVAWVERTLSAADAVLPDPEDATVKRYFRHIPECNGPHGPHVLWSHHAQFHIHKALADNVNGGRKS
jgi:hypothetical protein